MDQPEPFESSASPVASCLIVIPCFNEAAHIGGLLKQFRGVAERLNGLIVVADGGSRDGTVEIVVEAARKDPLVKLVHNSRRIQSAAINLAVERFGSDRTYLIRIDAHGGYPDDYCDRLVAEAEKTGADSIVVSMRTLGEGALQFATAAAQNSKLGTGGSRHRHSSAGEWVDHGHHALMRVSAFRAVGGYDESFSHNEDAELDWRLGLAGKRIWLTGATQMDYFPRASLSGLFKQYLGYGKGRARNIIKHRMVPKVRQALPLGVFPVVLLAFLAPLHWLAVVPFLAWAGICLAYGAAMAFKARDARLLLTGVSAMVMHFAWSLGFWLQLLRLPVTPTRKVQPA
ncbi:MAG: glycosyltransferase family 2 protein [Methylobacterium mesophilicum]|nr:glycosyltransferase family 2 protein [Methylobacterium mesophilicum]